MTLIKNVAAYQVTTPVQQVYLFYSLIKGRSIVFSKNIVYKAIFLLFWTF